MVEAIAMAHGWEMQHDANVVVIGQDVGANGGVFRATAGLQERFGKDRVQDTPLAEATIAGMSVGMATHGLEAGGGNPVHGISVSGARSDRESHVADAQSHPRPSLTCPVVMRMPHGGGIHAPEHHSESTESMLCHIPGIRVVCPSSPARAYGLLLAAIRDPDPVMFLEPVRLYRAMRQEVADDGQALPLDRCFILREGSDVTIVTWGAMTMETLRAGAELDKRGHQRRGHRSCDLEPDRHRDHPRLGGQDRPARDRARGRPQCRRRRGDCGAGRGARPVRSAGADSAGHRLRHHHAAVQARA